MNKTLTLLLVLSMWVATSFGQAYSEVVITNTKDARCAIDIQKVKFKSRKSLYAKIINDFDNQASSGYYLIVKATFTNHTKKDITLYDKDLIVEDSRGNQYKVTDDDVGMISGGADYVVCPPNMPVGIKVAFDVPLKQQYMLKLK